MSVCSDGALWIWNIVDEQFYGATQIVDLYHAREHYWVEVEAIRHALDSQGREQYYRPPVQSSEQPLGGFLGAQGGCLNVLPTNLSHTPLGRAFCC